MYSTPQKLIAEFLGTFALIFFGAGSICTDQYLHGAGGLGLLGIALAHGLAIGIMVSALGHISGGHFNPAVTIGLWVTKRMSTIDAALYWVAQLAGAIAAAFVLKSVVPDETWRAVALGAPELARDFPVWAGITLEGVTTFFLVLTVFSTAVDEKGTFRSIAGFGIGLSITLGILVAGPLTGAALNPARAFGPALAAAHWANHGVYWVGPLAGGFLAGLGRFRVNVFQQRGNVGMVLRVIPTKIRTTEELNLPPVLSKICEEQRGLVLVTGTTGSGKSTTLAAMIDRINAHRADHLITIEDPIEFLHRDKKSFINQREVEVDTANFSTALRAALRQDPDVILVGEMRDLETISTALLAAETGHLVLSTLHTLDATETIQRIIAVFPPPEQKQIRLQLSATLKAVVSQRLVRRADDKARVPASEVRISTAYISDCIINPDKTRLIHDAIAAGTSQYGMQTFDQSLFDLYTRELITYEEALIRASNPDDFKLRIQGIRSASDSAREDMERTMTEFDRAGRR